MTSLVYREKTVIYQNLDTRVTLYRAIGPNDVKVVVKEQVHSTVESANLAVDEAINQAKVFHPSIVRVYSCHLEECPQALLQTSLIAEAMDHDLNLEISERKQHSHPWTEQELLSIFTDLASALAYAQVVGVSHRDIKPQNVYVKDGKAKLGDFGSSAGNYFSKMQKTLQGTPFFLSPELKEYYIRLLQDPKAQCQYDAFKSDVYSLGVTFICMILLDNPEELTRFSELSTTTSQLLSRLPVSLRLKELLSRMLTIDPGARASLQEVESLLKTCSNNQPPLAYTEKPVQMTPPEEAKKPVLPDPPSELSVDSPKLLAEPERKSYPAGKKPPKQCLCGPKHPMSDWTLRSPELIKPCGKITQFFCSESCLRNFYEVCKHEVCVQCNGLMLAEKQKPRLQQNLLVLPCLHMFHGNQCVRQFFLDKTVNFTKKDPIFCPRCHISINPMVIETHFGPKVFAKLVSETHMNVCRRCGKNGELEKAAGCQHQYCRECRGGEAGRCGICDGGRSGNRPILP